jgi:serine/threonine-protein kinase
MPGITSLHRIGRYEVVGRLATGGMAEVLLGRLHGPHGFERPVVIKRILPHLAVDRTMVDMFLDEARIIANLHHPNLIQVHELGREGDELFMAMEFLEGESLSGVCRRLASRGELLDFDVAAHIIAETCAGLHAAHEATSADGRPLAIVHRDISPQNIFVSYSGAVHVIDFGIATTVDRIGRTEAGTIRGKFEYLAPEQMQSIPVDRRADVFALGVVLFELASGRRAYKRGSPAETMLAVLADPVPKIADFRPDVPSRLEEICSRALAKSRTDRYQTAAEMRRELVAFSRKRTDEDLAELCGNLMRDLFGDRISEKVDMLRRVRQGSDFETLPAAEVDIHVELPTAAEHATSASTMLSQSIPLRAALMGRGQRRRLVPIAGLVAAMVLGAGTVGWHLLHAAPPLDTTRAAAQPAPPSVPGGQMTATTPTPVADSGQTQGAEPKFLVKSPASAPSGRPRAAAPPRPAPSTTKAPTAGAQPAAPKPAPTLW